jgi:hypothetical protein
MERAVELIVIECFMVALLSLEKGLSGHFTAAKSSISAAM